MEQEEISQLLQKQDEGKIDSYIPKTTTKKQDHQSVLNLVQTWAHNLLYHKKIYPPDAFVQRNILGISVFAASSPPLKSYLDEFFQKFKSHIHHVNNIQILIVSSSDQIIQINTLHLSNFAEETIIQNQEWTNCQVGNRIQRDIEIKAFLYELNQKLKSGYVKDRQDISFRFRMGYRYQEENGEHSSGIVDVWVKREPFQSEGRVLTSLKCHNLNLIYEKS